MTSSDSKYSLGGFDYSRNLQIPMICSVDGYLGLPSVSSMASSHPTIPFSVFRFPSRYQKVYFDSLTRLRYSLFETGRLVRLHIDRVWSAVQESANYFFQLGSKLVLRPLIRDWSNYRPHVEWNGHFQFSGKESPVPLPNPDLKIRGLEVLFLV